MPLMSRSEYANYRRSRGLPGSTAASVTCAIQDGRIKIIHDGTPFGKVDSDQADGDWLRNTNPSCVRAGMVGGKARADQRVKEKGYKESVAAADATAAKNRDSFAQARSNREYYESELSRLKFEEKNRTLIPSDVVQKVMYEAGIIVRTGHDRIVSQLAPRLASETNIDRVEIVLRDALRDLDTELADRIQEMPDRFVQPEIPDSLDEVIQ